MSNKNLIIVPGLSSPFGDEKYQLARALLAEEAPLRGYTEVMVVTLPGQKQRDGSFCGELSLPSAAEGVAEFLAAQEKRGIPYRLLGLSFGGTVCLAVESASKLRHCEKIVLWGPSPFWVAWQAFVRGVHRAKLGKDTHLFPTKTSFGHLRRSNISCTPMPTARLHPSNLFASLPGPTTFTAHRSIWIT